MEIPCYWHHFSLKFCLVPCGRLSWLLACQSLVTRKINRIVSYLIGVDKVTRECRDSAAVSSAMNTDKQERQQIPYYTSHDIFRDSLIAGPSLLGIFNFAHL